jgi:hypothetical protein
MKRRVRKIANFFAFNLLFFALYLNFIHKDKTAAPAGQASTQTTAAFSGTVLVDNQEQFTQKKSEATAVVPKSEKSIQDNTGALKLSIN